MSRAVLSGDEGPEIGTALDLKRSLQGYGIDSLKY